MMDEIRRSRARTRKISGALSLCVFMVFGWMVWPHTFDDSSPSATMKSYAHAVQERDWDGAVRCLSTDSRETLAQHLIDRRFFDCYSGYGFRTMATPLVSVDYIEKVEDFGDWAQVTMSSKSPWMPNDRTKQHYWQFVTVVREEGAWKIEISSGPDQLEAYYDRVLPRRARGWALRNERAPL